MKKDTQRLLQKCGAGARMGVTGIAAVMRYVTDPQLLFLLSEYKEKHLRLAKRADGALLARGEKPKKPPFMLKKTARAVTAVRIAVRPTNQRAAEMMLKSSESATEKLAETLSRFARAEEEAKECAKELILLQNGFAAAMRKFAG